MYINIINVLNINNNFIIFTPYEKLTKKVIFHSIQEHLVRIINNFKVWP